MEGDMLRAMKFGLIVVAAIWLVFLALVLL